MTRLGDQHRQYVHPAALAVHRQLKALHQERLEHLAKLTL
jgi:hypothetical protein